MFTKSAIAGALALAILTPSAQAATIFTETFDGVAPIGAAGAGQAIGQFTVGEGEVDVLGDRNGQFYGCPGGVNNNCVDMNGNVAGSLRASVDLAAGDTYRLFFDLAGNGSRPSGVYSLAVAFGGMASTFTVPELSAFRTFSLDYTAGSTGKAALSFKSLNADSPGYWGPILDNVRVDQIAVSVPPAVPEPATWAMMIVGFGLAGLAMRRRRTGMVARTLA